MKNLNIVFVLYFFILLVGCSPKTSTSIETKEEVVKESKITFEMISQDEAKRMMDAEEVIILDVRTKAEYEEGHIKNALLLPLDEIEDTAQDVLDDKNLKILVYCRSGNRSKAASKLLVELGYKNIYEFGGINTWEYDIES